MATTELTYSEYQARSLAVRDINDALRTSFAGCKVVVTRAVADHAPGFAERAATCVRAHDDFQQGDDPNGEHDFGAFDLAGHRLFWKIDHYDRDMDYGSDDPTDRANTVSVLTIMFASDY